MIATDSAFGTVRATGTVEATPPRHGRGFGYFDLEDKLGVIGRGSTIEHAFEGMSQGVLAVLAASDGPPATNQERLSSIHFQESDLRRALITWVERVLEATRPHDRHVTRFDLRRVGDDWFGGVWGVVLKTTPTRARRVRGVDPSFAELALADGTWEARCLLDW